MSKTFWRILAGVLIVFFTLWFLQPQTKLGPEQISRLRFDRLIEQRAILSAAITPRSYEGIYSVEGTYQLSSNHAKTEFAITTHLNGDQMNALLRHGGAQVALPKTNANGKWFEVVPTLLIALLVIGLLFYQVNLGRGKGAHRVRSRPQIRFNDVAGIEEAKNEVQEVIDFLKDPAKYSRLGGKLPQGILLVGPPGTGKTMLAKAIAGEANASFFSASGSDFNEVFVGVGAKRVRELFRQARRNTPAIIFIDEIDCLGKNRRFDQNGELQQTNNALLTAMDGFQTTEGIIVIAATNRPEDLDEALLRPGRFDRKVYVPLPDAKGRRAILKTHCKEAPLAAAEHVLDLIAQTTPGMSGADLANLINEAAILSAKRNQTQITLTELEEARDKVRWGNERKSMVLKDAERRVVAYHEAGHAIIYLQKTLLPPLHKVSIIPRGQALGSTTVLPQEDQNIHSKQFLLEQLTVLMGGRAAEQTFCGDITNGANGDLDSAKKIARKMIHDWGMGQKLYYEPEKKDAETEINQLLTAAASEALQLIQKNHSQTARLAEALLKQETLSRDQVLDLINCAAASENSAAGLGLSTVACEP